MKFNYTVNISPEETLAAIETANAIGQIMQLPKSDMDSISTAVFAQAEDTEQTVDCSFGVLTLKTSMSSEGHYSTVYSGEFDPAIVIKIFSVFGELAKWAATFPKAAVDDLKLAMGETA